MRCPCGTTATVRVKSFHLCRRPNDTERQHLLCRDFKRRSGSKINRHHEVKARSVCLCRDDGEPVFYLLGGETPPFLRREGIPVAMVMKPGQCSRTRCFTVPTVDRIG